MRLLLDTHIFLWLSNADLRLRGKALAAIHDAESEVFLSAVSDWEGAIKVQTGKLRLNRGVYDFFEHYRREFHIKSLPLAGTTVRQLSGLPNLHRDPFERMLICQALEHDLTLVTADPVIHQYPVPLLRC